jgi:hypothetical protein
MGQLEYPDRCEQERARQALAEQLDAGVAALDVAKHSRHDSPSVKRRAVGRHGVLVAGAGGHVGERLAAHALLGGGLEPVCVKRNRRSPATDPVEVDLGLAPHADHAAASQHT